MSVNLYLKVGYYLLVKPSVLTINKPVYECANQKTCKLNHNKTEKFCLNCGSPISEGTVKGTVRLNNVRDYLRHSELLSNLYGDDLSTDGYSCAATFCEYGCKYKFQYDNIDTDGNFEYEITNNKNPLTPEQHHYTSKLLADFRSVYGNDSIWIKYGIVGHYS